MTTASRIKKNHMLAPLNSKDVFTLKHEGGAVLVHRADRPGTWARPVVDSEGKFYVSVKEACSALSISRATMQTLLTEGAPLKGRTFRFANLSEVQKSLHIKEVVDLGAAPTPTPSPSPTPSPTPKPSSLLARLAESQARREASFPFTGVRWPDGGATVRLSSGGSWQITRASKEELPREITAFCKWL